MKQVLIIGGNRFFGKRLAAQLLRAGHKLTLLNRGNLVDGLGDQVERISLDRHQLGLQTPVLASRQWDLVIDQVCYDATTAKQACDFFAGKTRAYLFTSTLSVYGPGRDIKEESFDPLTYRFEQTVTKEEDYGEGKRQAEATFFQQKSFPVIAPRFPFVLGTDDYTERLHFHIRKVHQGEAIFFPNPEARVSFIHAQDAADALKALVEGKFTGAINVGSPEPIRLIDLVAVIEKELGRKAILSKDGAPSPYGVKSDWFMNTDRLQGLGLKVAPIQEWLPKLVKEIAISIR